MRNKNVKIIHAKEDGEKSYIVKASTNISVAEKENNEDGVTHEGK